MKTIKEWLHELPEPYRIRALHNVKESFELLEITEDSLIEALSGAFVWSTTKEGYEFWSKFVEELYLEKYR